MADATTNASVVLWGREVAAVSWLEEDGYAVFQYDPEFAGSGIELSPLVMPLSPDPYSFPALPKQTFKGLPGLLLRPRTYRDRRRFRAAGDRRLFRGKAVAKRRSRARNIPGNPRFQKTVNRPAGYRWRNAEACTRRSVRAWGTTVRSGHPNHRRRREPTGHHSATSGKPLS